MKRYLCVTLLLLSFSQLFAEFTPINKKEGITDGIPEILITKYGGGLYIFNIMTYADKPFCAREGDKLIFVLERDSVILERNNSKSSIQSLPISADKKIYISTNSYETRDVYSILRGNIKKISIQNNADGYIQYEIKQDYQEEFAKKLKVTIDSLNHTGSFALEQGNEKREGSSVWKYILGILGVVFGWLIVFKLLSFKHDKKEDSLGNQSEGAITFATKSIEEPRQTETTLKNSAVTITAAQYDEIKKNCITLRTLFRKISRDNNVFSAVNEASSEVGGDVMPDREYFNFVVKSIFIQDLHRCYDEMGHPFEFLPLTKEGQCLILVSVMMSEDSSFARYDSFSTIMTGATKHIFEEARRNFDKFKNGGVNFSVEGDDEFGLSAMLQTCGGSEDDLEQYRIYLYRLISAIAKIDGEVTPEEQKWLEKMLVINEQRPEGAERDTSSSLPEEELSKLIGLQTVKEDVQALSNFISIRQKRVEMGLSLPDVSYHCVFTGNPGTGKTTMARILAGIYCDKGILKKGHLVETDRSGLVAEYVGQTAVKTNRIIDKALDGVLFIDEAYSLIAKGEDFGQEAIATLLKRMEDDRDRLIVILAGYTNEMKEFINSNPGLRSRFNRYIEFPDYSAKELAEIFLANANKHEFTMSDEVLEHVEHIMERAVSNKSVDFGNARYVRNFFERVVQLQANRLAKESDITREMLKKIRIEDLPNMD